MTNAEAADYASGVHTLALFKANHPRHHKFRRNKKFMDVYSEIPVTISLACV
jgi:hypothetical protein